MEAALHQETTVTVSNEVSEIPIMPNDSPRIQSVEPEESELSKYGREITQSANFIGETTETVSLTTETNQQSNCIDVKMALEGNQQGTLEGDTNHDRLVGAVTHQYIEMKQEPGGSGQTDINSSEEWKDIENIVDIDPSSTAGYLILSKEAAGKYVFSFYVFLIHFIMI
jgi:hypothetical protein